MKVNQSYAEKCLTSLVQHVFQHRDGLINGLTYEELAARIGLLNKHGKPHPRLRGPLMKMGHSLLRLDGKWGESIPQIQSLVVLKQGKGKGLPDDGIKEFWKNYENMSRSEKESKTQI